MMDDYNFSIEDIEVSESEWQSLLEGIAPRIGSLIISFNTLENRIIEILVDSISGCECDDEKAYIFISEMNYAKRVNALNKYFMFLIRTSSYNSEANLTVSPLVPLKIISHNHLVSVCPYIALTIQG